MAARTFYNNILEWKETGVGNEIITANQVNNDTTTAETMAPRLITTVIPPNTIPGQKLKVKSSTGETIEVIVPAGSTAGESITVELVIHYIDIFIYI
jgi:hypothetical protein